MNLSLGLQSTCHKLSRAFYSDEHYSSSVERVGFLTGAKFMCFMTA